MSALVIPEPLATKLVAQWLLADETDQLEFKRASGKMVGKAPETVCAFANADGACWCWAWPT